MSLNEANRIAHEVVQALTQEFPGADVLIHQDPAGSIRASELPRVSSRQQL
jgi:divalent metal cation (Fe/Co/Zn/Cd) transporter